LAAQQSGLEREIHMCAIPSCGLFFNLKRNKQTEIAKANKTYTLGMHNRILCNIFLSREHLFEPHGFEQRADTNN
jgi:hypothetical protein